MTIPSIEDRIAGKREPDFVDVLNCIKHYIIVQVELGDQNSNQFNLIYDARNNLEKLSRPRLYRKMFG